MIAHMIELHCLISAATFAGVYFRPSSWFGQNGFFSEEDGFVGTRP
jgi:hypothetical protein